MQNPSINTSGQSKLFYGDILPSGDCNKHPTSVPNQYFRAVTYIYIYDLMFFIMFAPVLLNLKSSVRFVSHTESSSTVV